MTESLSENLDRSYALFLVVLGKIISKYLEHLHKETILWLQKININYSRKIELFWETQNNVKKLYFLLLSSLQLIKKFWCTKAKMEKVVQRKLLCLELHFALLVKNNSMLS